jgi:hypothetical protein
MTGINAASNAQNVPDWHKVSPVTRVQPMRFDTSGADRQQYQRAQSQTIPPQIARRPQHTAATAASAFAAHILFEAEQRDAGVAGGYSQAKPYREPAAARHRVLLTA